MHVRFTSPLKVVEEGDGTVWRLLDRLTAEIDGQVWQVPAGFRTDFSSIPCAFRSIVPVLGRQNRASVLHDYLYVEKPVSRRTADAWFRAAMRACGVPSLKRNAMWLAVRVGGGRVWRA